MQDAVETCTRALAEAIRESEEYQAFENSKKKMKEYPALRKKMDEFRRDLYFLQNAEDAAERIEEMDGLLQTRQEFYREPPAAEYLEAEAQLCRMLQKITMEILNLTDAEIGAFEDQISI